MKTTVITVCQHKGGVGKTTTALNVAGILAHLGRKVLLIDMDPQENASIALRLIRDSDDTSGTIAEIFGKEDISLDPLVRPTSEPNLFAVPGHFSLTHLDMDLASWVSREWILHNALGPIKSQFDYVVIDTQPHLGIGTIMSFVAADLALAPLRLDFYSLRGVGMLTQLAHTIRTRLHIQPLLRFVCTMRRHTNLAAEAEEAIRNHLGDMVYKTVIPNNVKLEEAPAHGQTIIKYSPSSLGGEAYFRLTKEILLDVKMLHEEAV